MQSLVMSYAPGPGMLLLTISGFDAMLYDGGLCLPDNRRTSAASAEIKIPRLRSLMKSDSPGSFTPKVGAGCLRWFDMTEQLSVSYAPGPGVLLFQDGISWPMIISGFVRMLKLGVVGTNADEPRASNLALPGLLMLLLALMVHAPPGLELPGLELPTLPSLALPGLELPALPGLALLGLARLEGARFPGLCRICAAEACADCEFGTKGGFVAC